jgi:S1-C subfamily serine protease
LQKCLSILAAAGLAVGLVAPSAQAKSDRSRVVERARRQMVRIEVQADGRVSRSASGVVVAVEKGTSYVLTNAHVVQKDGLPEAAAYVVVIERPKLHRVPARLVYQGKVPEEDLAILAVEGETLPVVPIATEDDVSVGDDVVVIGAPYGKALSVSSGIVSQLEVDTTGPRPVQTKMKTDAPIGYGTSGGGVFDVPSGKLVGLVEGYRTARVAFGGMNSDDFSFDIPMPGETFLAPAGKIRAFLARNQVGHLLGIESAGNAAISRRIDPPVPPRR